MRNTRRSENEQPRTAATSRSTTLRMMRAGVTSNGIDPAGITRSRITTSVPAISAAIGGDDHGLGDEPGEDRRRLGTERLQDAVQTGALHGEEREEQPDHHQGDRDRHTDDLIERVLLLGHPGNRRDRLVDRVRIGGAGGGRIDRVGQVGAVAAHDQGLEHVGTQLRIGSVRARARRARCRATPTGSTGR